MPVIASGAISSGASTAKGFGRAGSTRFSRQVAHGQASRNSRGV
jgi:hypothetical protein